MKRDYPQGVSWNQRIDSESTYEFKLWLCYRGLGDDRSLRELAKRLKMSINTLRKMSVRNRWQIRLAAFEDWQALEMSKERLRLDRETAHKEARVVNKAIAYTELLLDRMLNKALSDPKYIPVDPYPLIQMIEAINRTARVGRGQPSDIISGPKEDPMDKLLESLKKYAAGNQKRDLTAGSTIRPMTMAPQAPADQPPPQDQ